MQAIEAFLKGRVFAVAGASQHPHKYGNKVFRALLASQRECYAINPHATQVAGQAAYASLEDLPLVPDSLSIVTPPAVTQVVVEQAIFLGVKCLWMQPGAESPEASRRARDAGLQVVDDGACLLVLLAAE